MPCYHPFRLRLKNQRRDSPSVFMGAVTVSCGKCVGCLLDYSRSWAARCTHEANLHEENCFITLTYDDDHLPNNGLLCKRDFQLFMKRLRSNFPDKKIRFMACGEYGGKNGRPHYHAVLFGIDFKDRVPDPDRRPHQDPLFISSTLSSIWDLGKSNIGSVTFKSAGYVARYTLKKMETEKDGLIEMISLLPYISYDALEQLDKKYFHEKEFNPFLLMSRKPGIGRKWYESYSSDVFPGDFLVINGKKIKVPRYYSSLYEINDPEGYEEIKKKRAERPHPMVVDRDRLLRQHKRSVNYLRNAEGVKLQKIKSLERD